MDIYKREAAFSKLDVFDLLAKDDDYIEITLWENGEGFDVNMTDLYFGLTFGQFKAMKKLIKKLKL